MVALLSMISKDLAEAEAHFTHQLLSAASRQINHTRLPLPGRKLAARD